LQPTTVNSLSGHIRYPRTAYYFTYTQLFKHIKREALIIPQKTGQ
jgi:hypothetical protein